VDLRRFLVEKEYRQEFLQSVRDPENVYFWQKEFPLLTGKPQAPLLTRLDTFLRPKLIRIVQGPKIPRRGCITKPRVAEQVRGAVLAHLLGYPGLACPTIRTLKGFHNVGRSDLVQPFQGWVVFATVPRVASFLGNPGLCYATPSG
jgi:hypothetical protein